MGQLGGDTGKRSREVPRKGKAANEGTLFTSYLVEKP